VSKQGISNQKQITRRAFHLVFMDSKLTTDTFCLIEIQIWLHLEHLSAHDKADWFHSLFNLSTRHHNLAEIIVNYTINFRQVFLPSVLHKWKYFWRHSEIWASSVDDCRQLLFWGTKLYELLVSVHHVCCF